MVAPARSQGQVPTALNCVGDFGGGKNQVRNIDRAAFAPRIVNYPQKASRGDGKIHASPD